MKTSPDIWAFVVGTAAFPLILLFSNNVPDTLTIASFLLNSFVLASFLVPAVKNENFIVISVWVFCALFFLIAPVVQLSTNQSVLVNTMVLVGESAARANLAILIFFAVFFLLATSATPKHLKRNVDRDTDERLGISYLPTWAFFIVALGVTLYAATEILKTPISSQGESVLALALLKYKVIYFIPFALLGVYLASDSKKSLIFIVIVVSFVLITKNPMFERRNAVGPVYLTILVLLFPSLVQSGRRYFYLVASVMLVFFPVSSVITHRSEESTSLSFGHFKNALSSHFFQLHYDAWANTVAIVEIVSERGLLAGGQILATILFFIPRSIWPGKPDHTGILIGDYLSGAYSMWFNNLSAPIPAEGYVDFGFLGSAAYAAILALLSRLLYAKSESSNIHRLAYIYLSFAVFFIARGALMPSVSFTLAALFVIFLVSRALSKKTLTRSLN